MEARIARIETHVEHINADVADLRASVTRLDAKIDVLGHRLDAKIDALGHRLDAKIDALGDRLDGKIDALGHRLDGKIDRLDLRIDTVDAKLDRHFLVLGGMIVTLAVGMAGLMAKGFHWL